MKCAGKNRQGRPCKSRPISDSTFCRWHGPNGIMAKYREYVAGYEISQQLQEIESTPGQRHEITWLYLRLLPTREQWEWLTSRVCDGPAHGPEDLTREQAEALIAHMRYLSKVEAR